MLHFITKLMKRLTIFITIVIISALIFRILFFKGPTITPTALPTSPIIDMHVHIAGLGDGNSGAFISEELQSGYKFNIYLKAFGVTREQIEQQGDQLVVEQVAKSIKASKRVNGAIILAMDGVINSQGELDKPKTQVYLPNEYVAQQTAKYPFLHFGASINPYRKDALQQLEKVKQQNAKLIKWIPNIQHIDPADKQLIPFYKKMKALNLPLLSHAGQERSFGSAIDEYGDPKRLELPLSLGVTVIAAHIATTGENENQSNYQRILPLFEKYPHFYSDISSLTQLNKLGYLDKAMTETKLTDHLLYGSDYPLTNMMLVSPYYFPLNLTFKQMYEIATIKNPWDRDIALKQALGVPTSIFARSAKLFSIQ